MKKCVAIIPARGGSKGLPRKNVLPLGGRPLIAWPCEVATQVSEIDRVICSTDDEEIAAAARAAGAETPFVRPAALATSQSMVIDSMKHALEWLQEQGEVYQYLLLLQATSPFVLPEDISKGLALAEEKRADTIISCVSAENVHPAVMFSRDEEGRASPLIPKHFSGTRRQEFDPYYMRVGALYIMRAELVMTEGRLYGERVYSLLLPKNRAVNIDDAADYEWAKFQLKNRLDG